MPYPIEQSEPGIVTVTWSGAITREELIRAVEARRNFANQHNIIAHGLILDLNAAGMAVIDVRLARLSQVKIDLWRRWRRG